MARRTSSNDEMKYDVKEKLGVLSDNGRTRIELRLVSFNDGDYKYDIRPWWEDDKGVEKMGKGIRLTEEELTTLADIVDKVFE